MINPGTTATQTCDTSGTGVHFTKTYDGSFWYLEPTSGAYSNYLGTWCGACRTDTVAL